MSIVNEYVLDFEFLKNLLIIKLKTMKMIKIMKIIKIMIIII